MDQTARLRLHVVPGARRTGVVGRHGDGWKVRVTAAPERGKANDAVVRLVAATLGLPRAAVTIVSGHGTRDKTVEITGADRGSVEAALESAGSEPKDSGR
ncbi:MAG TPA: DUF167 domain-containing protein [Gaiellaceae bacterium]|nr:DUF167 domain-containing protein [Gaiellaceae bacterium]